MTGPLQVLEVFFGQWLSLKNSAHIRLCEGQASPPNGKQHHHCRQRRIFECISNLLENTRGDEIVPNRCANALRQLLSVDTKETQ